jgi:membrane protein YqaA with SNARE-associated domain
MALRATQNHAWAALQRVASSRAYPFAVGGIALLFTISMTIPFASILIAAVLVRRERWISIVLLASLGSSTGGVVLYLVFYHLAWNQITEFFPSLAGSQAWSDATRWVSTYGTWALLAFAASPLPQMPALIFTAITRLPLLEVYLALLVGKLMKYAVYGWIAARFPSLAMRFLRFIGFEWDG